MKRITIAALGAALSTVLGLAMLAVGVAPAIAAPGASLSGLARVSGAARAAEPAAKPSAKSSSKPKPAAPPQVAPDGERPVTIGSNVDSSDCGPGGGSTQQLTNTKLPTSTPWAEQALNFRSVWPITEGAGVTVAVVDSGVDYSPQLRGKVKGFDLTGTALDDCVPHGTLVAGIIAASDETGTGNPFYGVAPAANILSIKVTASQQDTNSNATALLARGIVDAAALGARVINVSITSGGGGALPAAQLVDAVRYAQSRNAVIVASGGNDNQPGQPAHGPFYPAALPGVLSVGALNTDGTLASFSDQLSNVQVTAPGTSIVSTSPNGYYIDNGTSFATAFVSGVAALIIAEHPEFTEQEVIDRIVDTADGNTGPGTGAGMVNPLQAVTALALGGGTKVAGLPRQPVSVSRVAPQDPATRSASIGITLGSLGGVALLVAGSIVTRQGRRRRWRPGTVTGARTAAAAGPAPPGPESSGAPPAGGFDDIFGERW
jgi:membrane-anchored mycosin MYCP